MKKITIVLIILLAFSWLLSACRSSEPEETGPSDTDMVLTAAAQTADSMVRTMAAITPTSPFATPTITPFPATNTPLPTATQATVNPTLPGAPAGDRAGFEADLTVQDGTAFAPNATFTKSWRLKNTGTTTWTTGYTVIFSSGNQMGAPASLALPAVIAPGQTVDISISMVAPAEEGNYTGNYLLVNASGQRFGLDPGAAQPFYVVIVVSREAGTPAASPTPSTPTPGPTQTPGTGGGIVQWVFLSVDNGDVTGCPHSFNFTGQITLNFPAKLTYRLDMPNAPVPLPQPVTVDWPAGTQVLNFSLNIPSAYTGEAYLHVTAPEDVLSNRVGLRLACPYPTP